MSEETITGLSADSVEKRLRAQLAQAEAMLATAPEILRHLLAYGNSTLFSEEVIAHMRGMVAHIARQLLYALAQKTSQRDAAGFADERQRTLASALLEDAALMSYAHALVLEADLAARMQMRSGIDPVLCPLLQELTASEEASLSAAAMHALAAQARFMQRHKRMELPLNELPADLFDAAIAKLVGTNGDIAVDVPQLAAELRGGFDDAAMRTAQMSSLLKFSEVAVRSLAIEDAGPSLFITALAAATEQARELIMLTLSENQMARLAITMRAAGLTQADIERQLLYLYPQAVPPEQLGAVTIERASEILAGLRLEAAS